MDKIAFIYVNGHSTTVLLADYLGIKEKVKVINFLEDHLKPQ